MIKTAPLVSVVMPSFNQEKFVEAAIRIVLEQNYQSLELVIVDGGFSDGTLQHLAELLKFMSLMAAPLVGASKEKMPHADCRNFFRA